MFIVHVDIRSSNRLRVVSVLSNMKRWLQENRISYGALAVELNQSYASVCQKVNRKTRWQWDDCQQLREKYGLSSDFVNDFESYEALRDVREQEIAA